MQVKEYIKEHFEKPRMFALAMAAHSRLGANSPARDLAADGSMLRVLFDLMIADELHPSGRPTFAHVFLICHNCPVNEIKLIVL